MKDVEGELAERNSYAATLEARLLELAQLPSKTGREQALPRPRPAAPAGTDAAARAASWQQPAEDGCGSGLAMRFTPLADITPCSLWAGGAASRVYSKQGAGRAGSQQCGSPFPAPWPENAAGFCAYDLGSPPSATEAAAAAAAAATAMAAAQPAAAAATEPLLVPRESHQKPCMPARKESAWDGLPPAPSHGCPPQLADVQPFPTFNPLYADSPPLMRSPEACGGAAPLFGAGRVGGDGCGTLQFDNALFAASPVRVCCVDQRFAQQQQQQQQHEEPCQPAVRAGAAQGPPLWEPAGKSQEPHPAAARAWGEAPPPALPQPALAPAMGQVDPTSPEVSPANVAEPAVPVGVLPSRMPSEDFGCVSDLLQALTPGAGFRTHHPAQAAAAALGHSGPGELPVREQAAEVAGAAPLRRLPGFDDLERQLREAVQRFHTRSAEKAEKKAGPHRGPSEHNSRATREPCPRQTPGQLWNPAAAPGQQLRRRSPPSAKLSALKRGRLNRAADRQPSLGGTRQ